MIKNDYVISPDMYLLPSFKISPFSTQDIIKNKNMEYSNKLDKILALKLDKYKYIYTTNGRKAINIALSKLNLKKEDCVTIITTTNNFYISGCVTKEIEKFCGWSRKIEDNTKVIFVNHEFGFPYEKLKELEKYRLPIIEDCAHSFNSNNEESSVGKVGDFVIYSFPKYFPIQIGGLLAYKDKYQIDESIDIDEKRYIQKVISYYIDEVDNWSKIRRDNYIYLERNLKKIGLESRFDLNEHITPSVYMFKVKDSIDTDLFKEFLWKQGIESSVFYKEKAIYIPVNNKLNKNDLDYFIECIKYFIIGDENV